MYIISLTRVHFSELIYHRVHPIIFSSVISLQCASISIVFDLVLNLIFFLHETSCFRAYVCQVLLEKSTTLISSACGYRPSFILQFPAALLEAAVYLKLSLYLNVNTPLDRCQISFIEIRSFIEGWLCPPFPITLAA